MNIRNGNKVLGLSTALLCLLYLFWADYRLVFLSVLVCLAFGSLLIKKMAFLRDFLVSFLLLSFVLFFANGSLFKYDDEHSMYVAEVLFLFINLCFVSFLCFVSYYQVLVADEKKNKLAIWWICLFGWIFLCYLLIMQAIFIDFIENRAFYFIGYKFFLFWFLPLVYIVLFSLYRLERYFIKEVPEYNRFFWKFMLYCNIALLIIFLSFSVFAISEIKGKLDNPEEVASQDVIIDDTSFDMDVIIDDAASKVITEQAFALNILKSKCYKGRNFSIPIARQKIRECMLSYYQKCLEVVSKDTLTENIPFGTVEEIHRRLENKLQERLLLSGIEMRTFCSLPSEADIASDKVQGVMYSEISFETLWSREEAECLAQAWQYGAKPEDLLDASAEEIKHAKQVIAKKIKKQKKRLAKIKAKAERVKKWQQQKEAERIAKEKKKKKKIMKKMKFLKAEQEAFQKEQAAQRMQYESKKKEYDALVLAIQNKYDAQIREVKNTAHDSGIPETDEAIKAQLHDLQFARAKELAEQEYLWQETNRAFNDRQKAEKQILEQWWEDRARNIESGGKDISVKKARLLKKQLLQQVTQDVSNVKMKQLEQLKAEQEAFKNEQTERKLQHERKKQEYEALILAIQNKYDTKIKELKNITNTSDTQEVGETIKNQLHDLQFARAKELAEQEYLWQEENRNFRKLLKEERVILRQWWNEREKYIKEGGNDISAEDAQRIKEELLSEVRQKNQNSGDDISSAISEDMQ